MNEVLECKYDLINLVKLVGILSPQRLQFYCDSGSEYQEKALTSHKSSYWLNF